METVEYSKKSEVEVCNDLLSKFLQIFSKMYPASKVGMWRQDFFGSPLPPEARFLVGSGI